MSPWKTSEEKITELCERVTSSKGDETTEAVVELKAAIRERIRQIKDRASEVVPLIAENHKPKRTA